MPLCTALNRETSMAHNVSMFVRGCIVFDSTYINSNISIILSTVEPKEFTRFQYFIGFTRIDEFRYTLRGSAIINSPISTIGVNKL